MNTLERQREFFRAGGTLSVKQRAGLLKRLRAEILENEAEIAAALYEDLGKSRNAP